MYFSKEMLDASIKVNIQRMHVRVNQLKVHITV
jgi:hypothetical protein